MNNSFNYKIDSKFLDFYNNNLKQVFLYITDECNLRCSQCLYKPNTLFHMGKGEIEPEIAKSLLHDFNRMGAEKLTFIGGEPSLYGKLEEHEPLLDILRFSKELGYTYIRLDTNGQFDNNFLELNDLKLVNEIAFSLDGHTPEIHNLLRGDGAFTKCVNNIKLANNLGFKTTITTCVHRKLVEKDDSNQYLLDGMIKYAETLGVDTINFHALFKHAFPLDAWTEDTDLNWKNWIEVYSVINKSIKNDEYHINVRLPQHFVSPEEFQKNPRYYGYCPVKLRDRILVHPDGILRICSGLLGSQYGLGRYYDNKIIWDNSGTNETNDHKFEEDTACTNQSKGMDCGRMLPLCFSFKPNQKEMVWVKELQWDNELKGK